MNTTRVRASKCDKQAAWTLALQLHQSSANHQNEYEYFYMCAGNLHVILFYQNLIRISVLEKFHIHVFLFRF